MKHSYREFRPATVIERVVTAPIDKVVNDLFEAGYPSMSGVLGIPVSSMFSIFETENIYRIYFKGMK